MTPRSRTSTANELLTIADVARRAEIGAQVVRFYARTGLLRPARYAANGYRQFPPLAVKQVRFIRVAQSLGFTLAEIHEIMRRSRQRRTPCPIVREIIVRRLVENRQRLEHAQALQDRMELASAEWRRMPDRTPDGETICALIEAVADHGPLPRAGRSTAVVRR